MIRRFLSNYVQRHQNRVNQLLHLVGVPMTFVASVIFALQQRWLFAAGCFFGGYLLQFLGHAIEGNDAGEVILVKKALGLPYTEFAVRDEVSKSSD